MSAVEAHYTSGEPVIELESQTLDELRCRLCGEVIGVYEPLVACDDSCARTTSRAAEPDLGVADASYYHRTCYRTRS